MQMNIKKSDCKNLKDIYALLGVSWQSMYKWRNNATSTQSRNFFKHGLIKRASELFSLDNLEMESLANKAGLSLCASSDNVVDKHERVAKYSNSEFSVELHPCTEEQALLKSQSQSKIIGTSEDKAINANFSKHFNDILSTYPVKKMELYEAALVSDRMFRHIKSGRFLRKEPVLALLVVIGLNVASIQELLKMAGYILSRSISNDVVVMWLLENEPTNFNGRKRLYRINEILESLDLPLLMTREKAW